MPAPDPAAYLAFFRAAEPLKHTLRNSWTSAGRRESTAEHSWRLALMALALADELPEADLARLLGLLLIHDLGEAVRGDIPAPLQTGAKAEGERADLETLLAPLPAGRGASARALGRIRGRRHPRGAHRQGARPLETVLQHTEGANPADFDYAFNLGYGRDRTAAHPLIAALRALVDAETERRAREG
jgi:putative hydrolases of HD superfamily